MQHYIIKNVLLLSMQRLDWDIYWTRPISINNWERGRPRIGDIKWITTWLGIKTPLQTYHIIWAKKTRFFKAGRSTSMVVFRWFDFGSYQRHPLNLHQKIPMLQKRARAGQRELSSSNYFTFFLGTKMLGFIRSTTPGCCSHYCFGSVRSSNIWSKIGRICFGRSRWCLHVLSEGMHDHLWLDLINRNRKNWNSNW